MEVETIGKYQLHLLAIELGDGQWDAYVSILRFDDRAMDFVLLLEKFPAPGGAWPRYEDAIEAARVAGNKLVGSGQL